MQGRTITPPFQTAGVHAGAEQKQAVGGYGGSVYKQAGLKRFAFVHTGIQDMCTTRQPTGHQIHAPKQGAGD